MCDGFIHSVIEVCIVTTLVMRTQVAKEHQTVEHAVKRTGCQSSASPGTTHSRERGGNSKPHSRRLRLLEPHNLSER